MTRENHHKTRNSPQFIEAHKNQRNISNRLRQWARDRASQLLLRFYGQSLDADTHIRGEGNEHAEMEKRQRKRIEILKCAARTLGPNGNREKEKKIKMKREHKKHR